MSHQRICELDVQPQKKDLLQVLHKFLQHLPASHIEDSQKTSEASRHQEDTLRRSREIILLSYWGLNQFGKMWIKDLLIYLNIE